jgi:hypothetical protein
VSRGLIERLRERARQRCQPCPAGGLFCPVPLPLAGRTHAASPCGQAKVAERLPQTPTCLLPDAAAEIEMLRERCQAMVEVDVSLAVAWERKCFDRNW